MNLGYFSTLTVAQSAGATLTAAAAASALPVQAKKTLEPNFFTFDGQQLMIKATGKISSLITTPGTAAFSVKFGSTVVFDGLAVLLDTVAAHTNVGWVLELLFTVHTLGSAATLTGQGTWTCEDILGTPAGSPKAAVVAILPWNSAPAAGASFDSGVSQVVDLFFTQTVATGSMTLLQYGLYSPTTVS